MRLLREITGNQELVFLVDESAIPMLEEAKETMEKSTKLTHLHHLEDLPITNGLDGYGHALDTLSNTHDFLSGKRRNGYSIQTKFDGYPSIVWGRKDGKFFIGTKSFFNKTPKVNFNDKDIETNHANSPRLVEKLKYLFPILKKISPKTGVFQGDLMYTADEVNGDSKNISFTPNTLTYNVDKDSHEGRKIMKSKIGIAAHTSYEEGKNGNLNAVYDIDMSKFKPSDDVHFLSTKLHGPFKYTTADMNKFLDSLHKANASHRRLLQTKAFDAIKQHEKLLVGYINDSVRNKREVSTDGYIAYLYSQFKKNAKDAKDKKLVDAEAKNITANKKAFDEIFTVHKHLQRAKNSLVDVLSRSSKYKESILGEPSKPEGFVVNTNGSPVKLVDRNHFSSANFAFNGKVNPEDNPLVLHWGRFQGVTSGHDKMVKKGEDIARRTGARQEIVASRTKDNKNNPLTPQDKLKFLKTVFPGKNVSVAAPDKATIMAQLQHYNNSGVRDVTIVAGDDQVPHYKEILARYNGPGKLFNFNRARVISAGSRDSQSDGVESISGSKQREAAKQGDFRTFKSTVPKHLKPDQTQQMFHDMRASMGAVKIDSTTSAHSLAIYAHRNDKIGRDAKAEIARRQRNGTWKGSRKINTVS